VIAGDSSLGSYGKILEVKNPWKKMEWGKAPISIRKKTKRFSINEDEGIRRACGKQPGRVLIVPICCDTENVLEQKKIWDINL
jgi:hypothetical protein